MTQEEIQLLLNDLCARLPYGVEINIYDDYLGTMKDEELNVFHLDSTYSIEYRKLRPYLRPMSSMTEEERKEYTKWLPDGYNIDTFYWLLEHHFDFRGLIPMGLALEALKDMYKIE